MEMMRAVVRCDATSGDVGQTDMPIPEPGELEVLVEVRAFGVGIHDRYFIPSDARFPYVIGTEAAGVVRGTGAGVDGFAAGDRVLFASVLNRRPE